MKVILSVDPVKFPLTGIGRYTYELGKSLESEALESLFFLRGNRLIADMPTPASAHPMTGASRWKTLVQNNRVAVSAFRKTSAFLKAQALKKFEDHVFHGPNYYLPPFAGKSVVTIHDLSHYLWKMAHPPARVSYMQAEMELTLKRADAIITDTEYTRREVVEYFDWPEDRVFAVALAAGPEFRPRSQVEIDSKLQEIGLRAGSYCLFTGTVEPRKNIGTLVRAYGRLPTAVRFRWPLVIAGYRGWQSEVLHESLQRGQQEGWLRYLGYVPNSLLPILTVGARLFAYPSYYEGFGLPVVEAMASGVPVVCSNASTLPEVSGGAAALHDPDDEDTLLELLSMGLENEKWRESACQAGLQQAGRFSWTRCAKETLAVYGAISSLRS